jgi:hypothetical protein
LKREIMMKMMNKNIVLIGGILSILSVFLPWFSASGTAIGSTSTSTLSVNGLAWKSGNGMLLGLIPNNFNWEFQGIGVLALGIATILLGLLLKDKVFNQAMLSCGFLILGGGLVNLQSIGQTSGVGFGMTINWGVGYGLYVVLLGGALVASGGLLSWRDIHAK